LLVGPVGLIEILGGVTSKAPHIEPYQLFLVEAGGGESDQSLELGWF
jgi:hypothetical protein